MVNEWFFFIRISMANSHLPSTGKFREDAGIHNKLSGVNLFIWHVTALDQWQSFPITPFKMVFKFLVKFECFCILFLQRWFLKSVCFRKAPLFEFFHTIKDECPREILCSFIECLIRSFDLRVTSVKNFRYYLLKYKFKN